MVVLVRVDKFRVVTVFLEESFGVLAFDVHLECVVWKQEDLVDCLQVLRRKSAACAPLVVVSELLS
jgi:hypothetical protein